MTETTADVVIVGAGIAGVAAAYHLAARRGVGRVLLIDERPPLSLTSDKSTEAYRNWWPGPDDAMIRLMNRSIDLLEEWADADGNPFMLNRRGYVYATADPAQARAWEAIAAVAAAQGAGPLRVHRGMPGEEAYMAGSAESYHDQPTGADLLLDPNLIQTHFPYLTPSLAGLLHTRRCGWFSGQQLGMYLLERARAAGTRLLTGRLSAVDTSGGRVSRVRVETPGGTTAIHTPVFVNAAGPFLRAIGRLLGVELPVFSERHIKASFKDHLGIVPRAAPLLIWEDPQRLPWSEDERAALAAAPEERWLTESFPPGVHTRPEGGGDSQNILILWAFDAHPVEETFPLPENLFFADIVMRGMAALLPGLEAYFGSMPRPWLDGGCYTKTSENRLLSGPLPVDGAFVLGALSGFGLMAAPAAAELLAAHISNGELPGYAPAFALSRYDDPAYRAHLATWGTTGQL